VDRLSSTQLSIISFTDYYSSPSNKDQSSSYYFLSSVSFCSFLINCLSPIMAVADTILNNCIVEDSYPKPKIAWRQLCFSSFICSLFIWLVFLIFDFTSLILISFTPFCCFAIFKFDILCSIYNQMALF
jgi:hypothetical protein